MVKGAVGNCDFLPLPLLLPARDGGDDLFLGSTLSLA
jgi:hypothetical protein